MEEFHDKVINGTKPVVVDFGATWCGPCKILLPRLEAAIMLAEDEVNQIQILVSNWSIQYSQVDLAKVDIDDLADLAIEHGVNAVPTVIAVKNGEIVDKLVGVADEDVLTSFINKLRD